MNSTTFANSSVVSITDFYYVSPISVVISVIAVVNSILLISLIWKSKPLLHTVRHLLIGNSCIASILYCIIQTNNYIFLIFFPWETSDFSCRLRGYFSYVSVNVVSYSYLIQALSRFFMVLLSRKYCWLITFKTHYILILCQWCIAFILPLPAIITNDIYFRQNTLCWVPLKHLIHVIYTFFTSYIIPALLIVLCYFFIYFRVKNAAQFVVQSSVTHRRSERDLEVLRNIVIYLVIYLFGGLPSLLFVITASRLLFLIGLVTISLSVAVEKIGVCILDRDINRALKNLKKSKNQVVPKT